MRKYLCFGYLVGSYSISVVVQMYYTQAALLQSNVYGTQCQPVEGAGGSICH